MKRFILAALMVASTSTAAYAQRQVHVDAHTRRDGTYVPSHMRTAPNSTRNDNWSTVGNVNPHTGRTGTQPRDYNSPYQPNRTYTPRH